MLPITPLHLVFHPNSDLQDVADLGGELRELGYQRKTRLAVVVYELALRARAGGLAVALANREDTVPLGEV